VESGHRKLLFLTVALLGICAYVYWGSRTPTRPPNIPIDSTYVPISKTYKWVHCWLDEREQVNLCSIYQSDGTLLYTDTYIPYRGSAPVPSGRLKISERSLSNNWTVVLKDGTYLMRKKFLEQTKHELDQSPPFDLR
jgi:hypothetical protein